MDNILCNMMSFLCIESNLTSTKRNYIKDIETIAVILTSVKYDNGVKNLMILKMCLKYLEERHHSDKVDFKVLLGNMQAVDGKKLSTEETNYKIEKKMKNLFSKCNFQTVLDSYYKNILKTIVEEALPKMMSSDYKVTEGILNEILSYLDVFNYSPFVNIDQIEIELRKFIFIIFIKLRKVILNTDYVWCDKNFNKFLMQILLKFKNFPNTHRLIYLELKKQFIFICQLSKQIDTICPSKILDFTISCLLVLRAFLKFGAKLDRAKREIGHKEFVDQIHDCFKEMKNGEDVFENLCVIGLIKACEILMRQF